MSLLDVVREQSPTVMSNGQVKITCVFTNLHSRDSLTRQQLYLTPDLNAYHCFSCRSKGKLTKLLEDYFDVPYYEALDMVHLQEYKKEKVASLEGTDYYWSLDAPKEFLDRGYSKQLLKKFRTGYGEVQLKKGTVKAIHVPFYDNKGALKGVKFRIDKPDRVFWYSEGFNKEEYLYKNHETYEECILTEGETDLWRGDQFNTETTALLGVSMSDYQEADLKKYKKIYLGLDSDLAGVRAMRDIYLRLHKEVEIEFLEYPNKDLGNVKSFRELKNILSNAYSYAEFKLITGI
jgi:DNA primase